MARRSSARLRARQSTTPQPQRTNNVSPLPFVTEHDELPNTPGAFPGSASPEFGTPSKLAEHIERAVTGPIKSLKQHQHNVATPASYPDLSCVARDDRAASSPKPAPCPMTPQTCPVKASERDYPAIAVSTPGSLAASQSKSENTTFPFTFRAQSLELSTEARQLMTEKREEAARIKQQLDQESAAGPKGPMPSRKMASRKSRAGRYSDVHMAHFNKMGSIAEHVTGTNSTKISIPASTLKRTASKVDLTPAPAKTQSRQFPYTAPPKHTRPSPFNDVQTSPAKRIKRSAHDDAGLSRPSTSEINAMSPSTPKHKASPHKSDTPSCDSALARTQSSLQRTASVQASMIPTSSQSPLKSPAKFSLPRTPKAEVSLLSQSPARPPPSNRKLVEGENGPSLARSPVRLAQDFGVAHGTVGVENTKANASLARSPVRMPVSGADSINPEHGESPMLTRSPARPHMTNPFAGRTAPAPDSAVSKLAERFNSLRGPLKSILRTPQRIALTDLAKVDSGTQFATPEFAGRAMSRNCPKTEPVRKHVNFTASTKCEDGLSFRKTVKPIDIRSIAQNTFSYPSLPDVHGIHSTEPANIAPVSWPKKSNRRKTLGAGGLGDFTFRSNNEMNFAETDAIVFPTLPTVQTEVMHKGGKSTIRHISSEPDIPEHNFDKRSGVSLSTNKKRKFALDQENNAPLQDLEMDCVVESKEEDLRPAKRSRPNARPAASAAAMKHERTTSINMAKRASMAIARSRLPAKLRSKPSTLTQARLNALAMPKHRE